MNNKYKKYKKYKLLIVFITSHAFIILAGIIIIVAFFFPLINAFNYLNNKDSFGNIFSDNEVKTKENLFYKKLETVRDKYKNEKNISINTELIVSSLTFNKDLGLLFMDEKEEVDSDDYSLDEASGDSIYETAIKKIDLLAKFQIVNVKYEGKGCNHEAGEFVRDNSITPRDIAKNDGLSIFLGNEKNYKYIDVYGKYEVVIQPNGNPVKKCVVNVPKNYSYIDDNVQGVFYWNLMDEGFLETAYYKGIFDKLEKEEANLKLNKMVEGIYSNAFAAGMKLTGGGDINSSTGSFTPSVGSIISPIGNSVCRISQWSMGTFSHGGYYNKATRSFYPMALDIIPTVVSKVCAENNGNCTCPGKGNPILAMIDGKIELVSSSKGNYGTCSSNGIKLYGKIDGVNSKLYYEHLHSYAPGISSGVDVKQGDIIGYMGTTGNSTGVHLHIEIQKEENNQMKYQNLDELFKTKFNCK